MSQQLKQFLQNTTLNDVFPHSRGVITFDHDTAVGQVLEVLGRYKVLSAPVVVRPDSQPPRALVPDPQQTTPVKAILGFVGVGDILEHLLQDVAGEGVFELTPASIEQLGTRVCEQPAFTLFGPEAHGSSLEVLGWSDACRDWGLKGNLHESLISVIRNGFLHAQQVTSPSQRRLHMRVVHRLAVFDCTETQGLTTPHLKGIFSQSDLVRLIASHEPDLLGSLGKRTLQEVNLVQGQVVLEAGGRHSSSPMSVVYPHGLHSPGGALHRVVCVQEGTAAIEAFQVMYREKVSGIGIVAEDGRLIGNLSASDLRCLAPGLFTSLLLPVGQFLMKRPLLESVQQETAEALNGTTGTFLADHVQPSPSGHEPVATQRHQLVTCLPVTTFSEVLHLLAKHRLHRVYIVDPDQKPVGVVTMTDVLRTLSDACE